MSVNIQILKVLHIINSLATGGAEKLIIETLPLLHQTQDVEVDLALMNASDYPFYNEFKKKSPFIKVHEISKGSVYNPLLIFKLIPYIKKYDIIHVHLFPAMYWVAIAKIACFANTKMIFTEHSTNNRRLNNYFFRIIDRFIYLFYNQIICISPEVKEYLHRLLKISEHKLKIVTNGINIKKITSEKVFNRLELRYTQHDKIIIMVAGFRIEKDHETMLKAIKELPQSYKLLLVGDGYRRNEIEKVIQELHIESKVQLLGVRADVYALLKMSNIAVMSSHWEGFGLAAVEAMAAGIPIIASNVDGLAKVVENGGILFEKGNVEDLVKKILKVAENPETNKILVESGYLKAENYDIQKMVNQTIQIYTNAFE